MSDMLPNLPGGGPGRFLSGIRWGHGMIGKASVVAVALFVVIAIAVARVPSEFAILGLVLLAAILFVFFLNRILNWAAANPELAATEGATYVQSKQIAAKGMITIPSTNGSPDPQNPTLPMPGEDE